ncbi:hypothetical protein TWF718_004091 [Orbilia javanica]|uniref:O-methyltransferase domain-containing protein n=1 Tax=Orbilia javanica TaxID=47235 RepID=A0AAN8MXC6_9PEZI
MAPSTPCWPANGPAPVLSPKISELTAEIAENSKILENYIISHGLTYPSFAADGPLKCTLPLPSTPELKKIHEARFKVLAATKELHDLVTFPSESVQWLAVNFTDSAALQVIYQFNIAQLVPENGEISITDLSKKINVSPVKLGQVLRLAMTNHIFCEPRDGYVAHTAASMILRDEKSPVTAWVGTSVDEFLHFGPNLTKNLEQYGQSDEFKEAAFSMAFNGLGFFEYLGTDLAKARRFGVSMSQFSGGEGFRPDASIKGYDWGKLPRGSTVVDVGGATGFVSIEIAKANPTLKFLVEDISPLSLETGKNNVAQNYPDLVGRFQYVEHNFFHKQPAVAKGKDVYFLRFILHDWPDKSVLQILKNIVPAMKNGSKIVVSDMVIPPANIMDAWEDRRTRITDLLLLGLFNSYERREADWRRIFSQVDPKLKLDGFVRPPGSLTWIIEATFSDE